MGFSPSESSSTDRTEPQSIERGRDDAEGDRHSSPQESEQLRARGKGTYTCPHGLNCGKGGVEDGKLKIFTRNSDFR
jgi:hypothetical protein